METVTKLQAISMRIDKLDQTGEWLSECLAEVDNSASQAGVMISALAEDVRLLVLDLVTDLEAKLVAIQSLTDQHQKLH